MTVPLKIPQLPQSSQEICGITICICMGVGHGGGTCQLFLIHLYLIQLLMAFSNSSIFQKLRASRGEIQVWTMGAGRGVLSRQQGWERGAPVSAQGDSQAPSLEGSDIMGDLQMACQGCMEDWERTRCEEGSEVQMLHSRESHGLSWVLAHSCLMHADGG